MPSLLEKIVKVEKLKETEKKFNFSTKKAKSRTDNVKKEQEASRRSKNVDWKYLDQFKFTI